MGLWVLMLFLAASGMAMGQTRLLKELGIPTQTQQLTLPDICPHCVIKTASAEVLSCDAAEIRFLHIGDTVSKELMLGSVPAYRGKVLYKAGGKSHPIFFAADERRNPSGGQIFTQTLPDGSYFYAVWGYMPHTPASERVLTLFWQYPGSRVHSTEIVASEDEERYGPGAVELSQTRIVVRNDAFGICFETDQKKGKRYVTYWPDSGSFSFSKKPGEAGKPASALEVEAIAPLLR